MISSLPLNRSSSRSRLGLIKQELLEFIVSSYQRVEEVFLFNLHFSKRFRVFLEMTRVVRGLIRSEFKREERACTKVCRLRRGWRGSFETIIWPESIPASWLTSSTARNVRTNERTVFIGLVGTWCRSLDPNFAREEQTDPIKVDTRSIRKGRSAGYN